MDNIYNLKDNGMRWMANFEEKMKEAIIPLKRVFDFCPD